jgi:hypothetical protein
MKLNNKDWNLIGDRIKKILNGWEGKLLSTRGRLV